MRDVGELAVSADERAELGGEVGREGLERLERREVASQARRAHLEDALALGKVAEPVLAEVDQLHTGRPRRGAAPRW